jgi:hypothetical protein
MPFSSQLCFDGYDRFFVNDPYGNRIELMQVKAG